MGLNASTSDLFTEELECTIKHIKKYLPVKYL